MDLMLNGRRLAVASLILCVMGCKARPKVDLDARLIEACSHGNLAEASSLLIEGANPNSLDKNPARGFTALVCGIEHPPIVALLLEKGANPKMPDSNGILPVEYAASAGSVESLKLLLDAGADPNAKGKGESPLAAAAASGAVKAAALLIERGAEINFHAPTTGFTPLHEAIMMPLMNPEEREKMVEFLIAHSADVNAKDRRGLTPLDWAEIQDKVHKGKGKGVIAVLRQAGAKRSNIK